MMSREERLRLLGSGWEDATDEAVKRGLAFVILGGCAPSGKTPKKRRG